MEIICKFCVSSDLHCAVCNNKGTVLLHKLSEPLSLRTILDNYELVHFLDIDKEYNVKCGKPCSECGGSGTTFENSGLGITEEKCFSCGGYGSVAMELGNLEIVCVEKRLRKTIMGLLDELQHTPLDRPEDRCKLKLKVDLLGEIMESFH